MPPELAVLIENPAVLIGALFAGALIGIQIERFVSHLSQHLWAGE